MENILDYLSMNNLLAQNYNYSRNLALLVPAVHPLLSIHRHNIRVSLSYLVRMSLEYLCGGKEGLRGGEIIC